MNQGNTTTIDMVKLAYGESDITVIGTKWVVNGCNVVVIGGEHGCIRRHRSGVHTGANSIITWNGNFLIGDRIIVPFRSFVRLPYNNPR
jgi:hypothetical protein